MNISLMLFVLPTLPGTYWLLDYADGGSTLDERVQTTERNTELYNVGSVYHLVIYM